MRASRLLTIMMLLQTRGRMSAEALAAELEVSVRTIYRDVDQLSASDVPIYAETGRNGGFQLLDGWRTRLTGLTPPEAKALFLAGLPGPAAELGLGDAAAAAELKLLAALPADWQGEAQRISSRFHLDPKGWFQPADVQDHLKAIAEAVWSERRIAVCYESWKGVVERQLEPLGLVLKAGTWYMVAARDGQSRTYRLASIQSLTLTEEIFVRPDAFDLPAFWVEATAQFEKDIYVGHAQIRATALGLRRLKDLSPAVKAAVEACPGPGEPNGWVELTIPIEETGFTVRELTRIGAELEVLSPPELRAGMADVARRMAAFYAGPD